MSCDLKQTNGAFARMEARRIISMPGKLLKKFRHTGERRCPGFKINVFIDILDSGWRRND